MGNSLDGSGVRQLAGTPAGDGVNLGRGTPAGAGVNLGWGKDCVKPLGKFPTSLTHHSLLLRTSCHGPLLVLFSKQWIDVTCFIVTKIFRYLSQK